MDVLAYAVDREGSFWLGSRNVGLARVRRGHFTSYTKKRRPAGRLRRRGARRPERHALDGHRQRTECVPRRRVQDCYGSASGLPEKHRLVARRRSGGDTLGRYGSRLFRSKQPIRCPGAHCEPEFVELKNEALQSVYIRVIYEDRAGAIWIGTNLDGLIKYHGGRFTTYTTREWPVQQRREGAGEDRDGSLWIGTRGGGLNRLQGRHVHRLTTEGRPRPATASRDSTSIATTRSGSRPVRA